MQFNLISTKSAAFFTVLATMTACDQQKQTDVSPSSGTIRTADQSEDTDKQELVPEEVLISGKKIVDKIELYEQEHGFLPTPATALAIIPEGWVLGITDDKAYTLTKESEEGDGKFEYCHLPDDGDEKHGAWYLVTPTQEIILEE